MIASPTTRRSAMKLALAGAASAYAAGLIGAGTAFAQQNKPVGGVGVRCCKRPGGSSKRVRTMPSDTAGQFSLTVSEAGDQDLDLDKAALQMAFDAQVRAAPGQPPRIATVHFARGLNVSGPNGQAAVPGMANVFILSPAAQTFIVRGMAAGSVISGVIETVDLSSLNIGRTIGPRSTARPFAVAPMVAQGS